MSEFTTSWIETEERGWAAPVSVRVRPTEPWWKCHRVILIAGIGCFSGWLSCDEPRLRFLAAVLGAIFANGVFVGVPKLVRWLPSRIGVAARWLYLAAYNRRRVQFRLRTLFLLVILTGVALTGWNWISRREQDQFIAAIEGLGGRVTSDTFGPPWFPVRTVHHVHFNGRPLRDKDLAYLTRFPAPKAPFHCDLSSSLVTDAGLPHLAKWTGMDSLTLDRCQITDQGIREYARAKTGGLTRLSVADCRGITDGSLDDLLKLAAKINGDTGIRFTPTDNWNSEQPDRTFSVTYYVRDAEGNVSDNSVTIPITVTPKNAKPRAKGTDGAGAIDLQEGIVGTFSTVDDGGEGDEYANQALSYTVVTQPTSGIVTADGAGGWTFTPSDLDYNGSDSFEYAVTDDAGAGEVASLTSDSVIVGLNIVPVNDPPIANGDEQATDEDTPVSFTLTGADGDPMPWENQTLTFAIVDEPSYGTLSGFNPATGAVTYTPDPNWNSADPDDPGQHIPDSFSFIVTDDATVGGSALTSDAVTVTITVNPVNDPPVAVDDTGGAFQSQPAIIEVLDNDTDVDFNMPHEELSVQSVTQGAFGTVTNNLDGTVTYECTVIGATSDSFQYTVTDLAGATDTATVEVTISWGSTLMAAPSRTSLANAPTIAAGSEGFELLAADRLIATLAAAATRWRRAGADISSLESADFRIADLPGDQLALATASGIVYIDRDAAGFGWFVDATARTDLEFGIRVARTEYWATPNSRAFGRMDLPTAVMHEMGHLMGLDHAADGSHSVMEDTLATGVRRVPSWFDLAWAATGRRRPDPHESFFSGYGQEG